MNLQGHGQHKWLANPASGTPVIGVVTHPFWLSSSLQTARRSSRYSCRQTLKAESSKISARSG